MAERRPGGEFRKQCNISKSYHEEFLICRNRVDQFQGNAIYLNAYGESRIAPGGVTRMTCQGKSFFSQWCIELIEEGSGEFISRSLREPLQPGSLCIIRSDMMAEIHAAPDTPLFKRVLMVEKSSLVSLLCMHDFSRENEVLRLLQFFYENGEIGFSAFIIFSLCILMHRKPDTGQVSDLSGYSGILFLNLLKHARTLLQVRMKSFFSGIESVSQPLKRPLGSEHKV